MQVSAFVVSTFLGGISAQQAGEKDHPPQIQLEWGDPCDDGGVTLNATPTKENVTFLGHASLHMTQNGRILMPSADTRPLQLMAPFNMLLLLLSINDSQTSSFGASTLAVAYMVMIGVVILIVKRHSEYHCEGYSKIATAKV